MGGRGRGSRRNWGHTGSEVKLREHDEEVVRGWAACTAQQYSQLIRYDYRHSLRAHF